MKDLDEYRRRRDFGRTKEPAGETPDRAVAGSGDPIFVVHKHDARRLHYDLRLERAGVLESWAVPKGPGVEVGARRLAIHVEDHPLDYADFEGTIPKGEYGGGTVMLWDRGTWRETRRSDGRIDFELAGHKLRGAWSLTRMGNASNGKRENWLLIKRSDKKPAAAPIDRAARDRSVASGRSMRQIANGEAGDRQRGSSSLANAARQASGSRRSALPRQPRAQLATLVEKPPEGPGWLQEIKFDGYRILAMADHGDVSLWSRNGKNWTARFPAIAAQLSTLPAATLLLDGEVIALRANGLSSFRRLQEMLSDRNTKPAVYQAFDILHVDGIDLAGVALIDRKDLLRRLLEALDPSSVVRYSEHVQGDARQFYDKACEMGLEGIICKRADARYRAVRNRDWLKVKCVRHEELIIGGYSEPSGSRTGFGALLLGANDSRGRLIYAGKVGAGFTERQLAALHEALAQLETRACPFHECPERRGARWVEPRLVVEVAFTEWTRDGRLRHPVFRGLREDKDPKEIRMPERALQDAGNETRPRTKRGVAEVAGVALSNPDRVLYPQQKVTKLAVARYYEEMSEWILPQIRRRPLSLLRCPQGRGKDCFFQKHPGQAIPAEMPRVSIREKNGKAEYLYVEQLRDLVALVQAGTLELHAWGCTVDDVERPDLLVFDLDPGPDVDWTEVLDAARSLQDRLQSLKLEAFIRTTGGKGLHVVVPLRPGLGWDGVKAFAKTVAAVHAREDPGRFTINMSKEKRKHRIFIDYLRNGRGNTAIVSYSTRAREGAPVAVPVRRDELKPSLKGDRYDIDTVRRRVRSLQSDPWHGFEQARRPLTSATLRALGVKEGAR